MDLTRNNLGDAGWADHIAFRFGMHGLAVYPPGGAIEPRTLRDYEFVYLLDGSAAWRVDGSLQRIRPGMVTLMRPGMREAWDFDRQRQSRHHFIHFQIDRHGARLPAQASWPLLRVPPVDNLFGPLFAHLAQCLVHRGAWWEARAQAAMRLILLAFLSGEDGFIRDDNPDLPVTVQRVLDQVLRSWEADGRCRAWSLTDLARLGGCSPGHLGRLFKGALGVGPVLAVRRLRLERAAALITSSDLPLAEIARRSGFRSAFHFSRCFRHLHRLTPSAFRKRKRAGLNATHHLLAFSRWTSWARDGY